MMCTHIVLLHESYTDVECRKAVSAEPEWVRLVCKIYGINLYERQAKWERVWLLTALTKAYKRNGSTDMDMWYK